MSKRCRGPLSSQFRLTEQSAGISNDESLEWAVQVGPIGLRTYDWGVWEGNSGTDSVHHDRKLLAINELGSLASTAGPIITKGALHICRAQASLVPRFRQRVG